MPLVPRVVVEVRVWRIFSRWMRSSILVAVAMTWWWRGGEIKFVAGEVVGEGFLDDVGVLVLGGDLFVDLRDLFRVGFSHSVDPCLDLEVCHADDEAV